MPVGHLEIGHLGVGNCQGGTQLKPLHSGAPGGAYQPDLVKFKDGTPVAKPRDDIIAVADPKE
jgi:hypothetical protein